MANREQSIGTVNKTQIRLEKNRELQKRKRTEETEACRQARLQSARECKRRRHSIETNCERQLRLNKDRFYQKQKYSRELSQSRFQMTQQDYLSRFSNLESDSTEEQCWAKANILNFINLCVMLLVSVRYVMKHGLGNLNQTHHMCAHNVQEIKNLPKNFRMKIP